MPGWKRDIRKRLDPLIVRNVPNLRKPVKWNTPFYGIEGQAGSWGATSSRATSRFPSSAAPNEIGVAVLAQKIVGAARRGRPSSRLRNF